MAATLIGSNESFLYSGEYSRFYVFYWCLRSGEMDRFFPSSKQHENWSRNYKWPPRGRDQRQRDTNSPTAASSQSTIPKLQRHGSTTSVRSRDRREGSSRAESVCDRGITLRPEDLLLQNDDIFSLYPRSVFPRSNPTSPHSLPIINPSAYLSPTSEPQAYGSRRMALGGSASELHTKTPETTSTARRSSDGNYSSYATQTSTAARFLRDAPQASIRRKVLRVPQDSVDTASESSISSLHGAEAAASTTSADVETLSSSTSSISGRDGDPTTTSSPLSSSSTSPSDSTSNDSRFSSSTKCSYCRLVSSGDSTECCCVCTHNHGNCSCTVTTTTPEETQSKLPQAEPSAAAADSSSMMPPQAFQPEIAEPDQPSVKPKRKLLPPNRVTSFTDINSDDPDDENCPSRRTDSYKSPSHSSLGQGLNRSAQRSPSLSPVSDFSPSKRSEGSASFSSKRHFVPDVFYSERSPIKDRHIRKTSYSFAGTSPRKTQEKKEGDEDDGINLRVYSPNAFSYHRLGSSYSRSRCRSSSKQNSKRSDDTDNQSTSLEFNALDSSETASYPSKPENVDHATSRHHSVPKIKTSRYRRSSSHNELEKSISSVESRDTTSCLNTDESVQPTDNNCLNMTNLHIPLSRTRYKHNLLSADTNLRNQSSRDITCSKENVIYSPTKESHNKNDSNPTCRIALTKDTSPETSESVNATNSKSSTNISQPFKREAGEKKKASKILHTKVTLVKREPLPSRLLKPGASKEVGFKSSDADSSSVSQQKDVKNNPPYTYRFGAVIRTAPIRKRTTRPKQHSCIHSPTKSIIINVPEENVETIEVPHENRRFKANLENKKSSSSVSEVQLDILEPDGLSAEADIDESTSAVVHIEPLENTVSDSISSFAQDIADNLDVENLEGQNSGTDISESLVSPLHEAKDNSPSVSSEGIEKDVGSGQGETTTDVEGSAYTKTKTTSKVTSDSECSSSYCLCAETSDQLSRLTEPRSKEEGALSEEECSLCQKEKRALSPEILILKTTEEILLEQSSNPIDRTNVIVADSTSLTLSADVTEEEEPSITSTLTSSTSALKMKTPDFLSADFPFEPEIVHRANPSIDEAEDEICLRNLGSPFRRLSEEEFIATLNIHDAAGKGDLHVVKLLVKKEHKQMETVDERGWTPIHLAAARGHTEIVQYLAQEGAHLAALDPSSYTAIHLAAMNGFHHCLEILLQLGVDVDCVTAEGFTPLHLAAMNAHLESCHILLHWGASLDKRDALGRRVQDMIEEYGLDDVAILICRFKHQLKKFREVLKKIPTFSEDKGGASLMASLSQLNESEVPKEIIDMLAALADENEHD